MIRQIVPFAILTSIFCSCSNYGKNDASLKSGDQEQAIKVEFSALIKNPDSYINKNIIVEGKVIHVCTMSGKKLFIAGENPEILLYVAAGENMPKFPMELLGSDIAVEGVITRIAGPEEPATNGNSGSGEVMKHAGGLAGTASTDSCEIESALATQSVLANLMMEYKSHKVK